MSDQTTDQTPGASLPATLRHDPVSHYHWLDFGGFPGQETHDRMKAAGWRWSRYREQYRTNRRYATPPAGIAFEDEGACDYSAERADRLTARAEKHQAASTTAYNRSNALVANIPLGQPILVGHHSERGHRATLEKSRRAMDRAVEEDAVARDLRAQAAASARHQQQRTNVRKMADRRDRLGAEMRKYERDALTAPGGRSSVYDDRIALLRAEIATLQAAIDAAGGEAGQTQPGQAAPFEKGDLIRISGFSGIVKSIGPKTVTVLVRGDWPLKLPRNRFQERIATAAQVAETRAKTAQEVQA